MEYDMKDGSFSLWMSSYVKVKCQMTYDMYPFDTQTCKFEMKSVTSNLTYQVLGQKEIAGSSQTSCLPQEFTSNVAHKDQSLNMDMFDVRFGPLGDTVYVTQARQEFSLAGFVVDIRGAIQ